jgi:hypothetical protein
MQTTLHRWAAADPGRRFDDLFNFVHDPATLVMAFDRVAGNQGANTPGVDGLTVAGVEERIGVPGFLDDLRAALKDGSFRPLPVRERKIPKPGGAGKVAGAQVAGPFDTSCQRGPRHLAREHEVHAVGPAHPGQRPVVPQAAAQDLGARPVPTGLNPFAIGDRDDGRHPPYLPEAVAAWATRCEAAALPGWGPARRGRMRPWPYPSS